MRFHARYQPRRGGCLTLTAYVGALILASMIGLWLVWVLLAFLAVCLIAGHVNG
jgi:hypothetical protein